MSVTPWVTWPALAVVAAMGLMCIASVNKLWEAYESEDSIPAGLTKQMLVRSAWFQIAIGLWLVISQGPTGITLTGWGCCQWFLAVAQERLAERFPWPEPPPPPEVDRPADESIESTVEWLDRDPD